MPTKQEIVSRLMSGLDRAAEVRSRVESDPGQADRRQVLRAWQAERLAATYPDLLGSPRYHATAEFFLSDIYGPRDLTRHEASVRKLVPMMEKLLPAAGLDTIADAVELNALSESLDAAMTDELGAGVMQLDAARYAAAYRKVGCRPDRERQITLICDLGRSLDKLTRQPLIGTTLAMMRKPARLAGLAELQTFLERGYDAFRGMKGAGEFLDTIATRESELLGAMFAGDDGRLVAIVGH